MYLVDLATGRVRWHATTFIALDTLSLVTAADVISLEGGAAGYPASHIAGRNAADGTLRWTRALSTQPFGPQPVVAIGSQAVVQTGSPTPGRPAPLLAFQTASGQLAWHVDVPTLVQTRRCCRRAACSSRPPIPATPVRPDWYASSQRFSWSEA